MEDDDPWELVPENAHPLARSLLTAEFFWDCVDQDSPFGNDTGADVLAFFRDWQADHVGASGLSFLTELLHGWEVADADWDEQDEAEVARLIAADEFSFTHRDDSVIGLAFAQLVVEGRVDAEVRERALMALHRQSLQPALNLWSSDCRQERLSRLEVMRSVLLAV